MRVDDYLMNWTDKPAKYWMNRIGHLIAKNSYPIKSHPGLSQSRPKDWLAALSAEIAVKVVKKLSKEMDENIGVSRVVSIILLLWSYRIGRAKSYDRRRPVDVRKGMMQRQINYAEVVLSCLMDDSLDSVFFPAQEWDNPFLPNAKYEPDEMQKKREQYAKKIRVKGKK